MKIYTKGGDNGMTSLVGGERVGKDDLRVEAYGSVDELSAFIALLHDTLGDEGPQFDHYRCDLQIIQGALMSVEALLASGKSSLGVNSAGKVADITEHNIAFLEDRIDEMDAALEPLTRFTIPGGHRLVSLCHVCRTVCRRAERAAIRAAAAGAMRGAAKYEISANAMRYLNRLSDYFYQLGRMLRVDTHSAEIYWNPPGN